MPLSSVCGLREWKMELGAADLKPTDTTNAIQDKKKNDKNGPIKRPNDDEEDKTDVKKIKVQDENETLECLKNLCELVSENDASSQPNEATPPAAVKEEVDIKPESEEKKKKKKKKKRKSQEASNPEDEAAPTSSTQKPKDEKSPKTTKKKTSKGNMRKNIREILKDNELEAETRAAQQREIERVQRLQQQQRQQQQQQLAECSYIPSFEVEEDDEDDPTSTLVEDLQALAQELEDNTLSPENTLDFINQDQHRGTSCSPLSADIPPAQVGSLLLIGILYRLIDNQFLNDRRTHHC